VFLGASNLFERINNLRFSTNISLYLGMIQLRAMVAMEGEYETVPKLSNSTIFNNLSHIPPISRSRHYLMLNISETIRDIDIQGGSNENTSPDKMQFLDNRVRFLHPNFLVYMGEILLQF